MSTSISPAGNTPKPRRLHPVLRSLFRFLGSLKLAMLLLAVIILACIVGTVTESKFDTAVAQAYFYNAPWFLAWLTLLCLNLIGAVLVRYPWKPHQIGFIITHAGIVVMLIGAVIGRYWGVEGSITLVKGQAPANTLVVNESVLDVQSSAGVKKSIPLDLEGRPPSADRPVRVKLGDTTVAAVGLAKELGVRTIVDRANEGSPALRVILRSAMIPQPVEQWLLLGDYQRSSMQFGPTIIQFASAAAAPAKAIAEPAGAPAQAEAKELSREKHFVFAKMPEMAIAKTIDGEPTGFKAVYIFGGTNTPGKGLLQLASEDQNFNFPVEELVGRETPLKGTPWTVQNFKYLADFRIEGNQAVSASDIPNNPALIFELAGAVEKCDHSKGECKHPGKACCPKPGKDQAAAPDGHSHEGHSHDGSAAHGGSSAGRGGLTILYNADKTLSVKRSALGPAAPAVRLEVGRPVPTGLADWTLEAKEFLPKAVARDEFAPLSGEAPESIGTSGVLFEVRAGERTERKWVPSGTAAHFELGKDSVHLSYGYKTHPLGFNVSLDKFEVEMNEGTSTPGSFKSFVQFTDPKASQPETAGTAREIWMNHPANFPNFTGAGWLGLAYKFSQASWNPNNLNQTTLQVMRDPGWSLKWIGSLLLCAGIFTMFYLKPYPNTRTETIARRTR